MKKCVVLFKTEVKYIATTKVGNKMTYVKRFLQKLNLQQIEYVAYCDGQSAISLSKKIYVPCKKIPQKWKISLDS